MRQSLCAITSNVEISPGVRLMWIEAPHIAAAAQPGQFITVRCEGLAMRRPFSIHRVVIASEAKQSQVAILFKVVGKGTLWLSQRQEGDRIDILGPLGKGFWFSSVIARRPERKRRNLPRQSRNLLLVAGGIGIAPLIFLTQYVLPQHSITLIHGTSTARELYPFSSLPLTLSPSPSRGEGKGEGEKRSNLSPLPPEVRVIPVTEDGTAGKKGMITDILPDFLDWADQIYACGPVEMYQAMALTLNPSPLKGEGKGKGEGEERSNLKKCQISLEVRMGCGIGACYGCTINTTRGLKQVCRDGPVFELGDIIWGEVRI